MEDYQVKNWLKVFVKWCLKEKQELKLKRLIDSIDCDKNNYVEFEEFLSAFMDKKKLLSEENLKETFLLFDNDRSGKISVEKLKKILSGN